MNAAPSWSTGTAVISLILALLLYDLTQRLLQWRRLRHIPGPAWAGFTDLWIIKTQWSGRWAQELRDVCDKYGPIARIGPNTLITSDANELRRIGGARSAWKRSKWWYRSMRLDPTKECVLSLRNDREHHALRSKLLPGYTGRDVDGLHSLIDNEVLKLVSLIEKKYVSEVGGDGKRELRKLDLARIVQYFTLDVISSIAFGKSFGHLEKDEDVFLYIRTTDAALPVMVMSGLLPPVLMLLQSKLMRPLMPKPEDSFGLGKVIGIAREAVATRFGEKKQIARDMLGSFVAHGLTKDEAEAEAVVQVVAGSDTTATAIRATLLHIITSPRVYRKLQREIDQAMDERTVSRPVIADAEARALPYLQAVIKEGLRIFPPVTGMMPKMSEQDDTVCGQHVPAGTNVCWSAVAVMRNKQVFGEDADVFCPERWLGASLEKQREMEQWTFQCFSRGMRWECLGKDIAFIELNKLFFELFRRFDVSICDPTHPWTSYNAAIFIQHGLHVQVLQRRKPR